MGGMSFDMNPADDNPHLECAREIEELRATVEDLKHACLAAVGFLEGQSILNKEQVVSLVKGVTGFRIRKKDGQ
jgi:hypothetical protein